MRNKNVETTRAAFMRKCSDKSNNLIFPEKMRVDRGKEKFAISVQMSEFTYTILSARQKLVSLNLPLDL